MTQAIDVHSLESPDLLMAASHSPPIGIPRSAQHRRIQSSNSLIDNFLKAVPLLPRTDSKPNPAKLGNDGRITHGQAKLHGN